MVRENKSSTISAGELINKAVKKAQMSSHTVNNLIAAGRQAKKGVAALAAVKTAMNQQANANYKKAQDKVRETKQNLRTFKGSLHEGPAYKIEHQYDVLKKQVKDAEKNVKNIEKHRK